MSRFLPLVFIVGAVLIPACSSAPVAPTPTPEPPTPAAPPTDSGDGVISATPRPPGVEGPNVPAPYDPQPSDASLQRDTAFVDSAQIIIAESFPPQFFLSLAGSLPTPCHSLRVSVAQPGGQSRIVVDVYSVVDPTATCVQVLEPFSANVRLGALPAGKYEVWVNGQPLGEIEAP